MAAPVIAALARPVLGYVAREGAKMLAVEGGKMALNKATRYFGSDDFSASKRPLVNITG